jgi:hypothetical protein
MRETKALTEKSKNPQKCSIGKFRSERIKHDKL